MIQVIEPRKEQEGTKEMFVSYGIRAEVCVYRHPIPSGLISSTDEPDAFPADEDDN